METFRWILGWLSCFKCFHAFHNLWMTGKAAVAFHIAAREFPALIKVTIVEEDYVQKQVLISMNKPVSYLQRDADAPTILDFL
jgi:hypothetical protein